MTINAVVVAAFSIAFVLVFLWFTWATIANSRTAKQRRAIVDAIFAREDWHVLLDHYHDVDYYRHARAVELGRDPFALYHSDLLKALGK